MFQNDDCLFEGLRLLLAAVLISAATGCAGESTEDSPTEKAPSGSTSTESALSPNSDRENSGGETAQGGATTVSTFEEVPSEDVDPTSNSLGLLTFDLRDEGHRATTTIHSMGDVIADPSGTISIEPTPVFDAETGRDVSPDWSYETRLSTIVVETSNERRNIDISSPTAATFDGSGIEYDYEAGVSVRYDKRRAGLKQAMSLGDELAGSKQLRLQWSVPSEFSLATTEEGNIEARLEGSTKIVWKDLVVHDADGDRVDAVMRVADGQLVYELSTADVSFPLKVDPLATSPTLTKTGEHDSAFLGEEVDTAGDVNGDGYTDLLINEPGWNDPNGVSAAGRAHLHPGSQGSIQGTASWTTSGDTSSEFYGRFAEIGDYNGDGNNDVAVSGRNWTKSSKAVGRVRLYLGKSTSPFLSTTPTTTLEGSQDGGFFGRSMAGGDFDCDGTPDLAVGVSQYDGPAGSDAGRAHIFFGQSSSPYLPSSPSWTFDPPKAGGRVGIDMSNAGDVDDDGCEDLLVGSWKYPDSNGDNAGRAMLFLGKSGGPAKPPAWSKIGPQGSFFGRRVSDAGDVNNDNYDDIAIGAYGANGRDGFVHVYYGTTGGVQTPADWTKSATVTNEKFGFGLSSNDVNNDGTPDLAVGAANGKNPNTGNRPGAAYIFLTDPTTHTLSNSPKWTGYGTDSGSNYGLSVTLLKDATASPPQNADLVVGALFHDDSSGNTKAGAAFGYPGNPTCYINGTFYDKDEKNPSNTCEICKPSQSRTSWSDTMSGASCDDGSACTKNDSCDGSGNCTGTQITCDDNNPCTQNNCDPSSGCVYPDEPAGTSCPDDGKSCTSDECDGSGSCTHPVSSGCLINGSCVSQGAQKPGSPCQQCQPSKSRTSYTNVSPGTSCDDGKYCTVNDACNSSGQCVGTSRDCKQTLSRVVVECNQSFSCDERLDTCSASNPVSDGTSCSDGSMCTSNSTCQSGVCKPGSKVQCSPCKECDPNTGNCSITKPDGTSCDSDNDVCTVESCQSGSCTQQMTRSCDDGDPCTTDTCDSSNGCQHMQKMQGATCGDPMCNDSGNLVQAPVCDSSGNCQNPSTMDCGTYECTDPQGGMASCPDSCSANEDCKDGNYCVDRPDDQDGDKECFGNRPPIADAGMDQTVKEGSTVNLDGSQSGDPDGDSIDHQWSLASSVCPGGGESDTEQHRSTIQSEWTPTEVSPSFTMPPQQCPDEVLTFELVVEDQDFKSDPDEVDVTYGECEEEPVADIAVGAMQDESWGSTLTYDGSGSRTGCGASLDFSWSYEAQEPTDPAPPSLTTTTTDEGETFEVELPDTCRESRTRYEIRLQVHDGVQTSMRDTYPLVIPPNGPCEGTGDAGVGGDAADAGGEDVSGSSCFCSAGDDRLPTLPASLVGALLLGGLARLRRRLARE